MALQTQAAVIDAPQAITRIDVVIPVLNEEQGIAATLKSLAASFAAASMERGGRVPERRVYVVDGGSTDRTVEVAASLGAEVLQTSKPGRGNQIAAGVAAGCGDLILMLHADAKVRTEGIQALLSAFECRPNLSWGIMGHSYDTRSAKMQIIELSNRLRFAVGGIAFGDQGIFVRRAELELAGGVPAFRLMEDVELSLRLRRGRKRTNLGQTLVVSARRWKKKGFTGYTFQVLRLVTHYLLARMSGADASAISDRMYDTYYGKRNSSG